MSINIQVSKRAELAPAPLQFLNSLVCFAQFAQRTSAEKFANTRKKPGEVNSSSNHGLDASICLAYWIYLMDWGRHELVGHKNLSMRETSPDWSGKNCKSVTLKNKSYKSYLIYLDYVIDWTDEIANHKAKLYAPVFEAQSLRIQLKEFCELNKLPQARIESLIERYGLTEFSVMD